MRSPRLPPEPRSANDLAEDRTRLALSRTMMAADRSLMAWVRTALSMISFGFGIYKFLDELERLGARAPRFVNSPRLMGLFLIGLGTGSMFMGTIEFWYRVKGMSRAQPLHVWRPSFIIALLLSVSGTGLFVSVLSRVL